MAVRGIDRYKYMPGVHLRTLKREKLIFQGADFSLFLKKYIKTEDD